jgi:hypothetical protein
MVLWWFHNSKCFWDGVITPMLTPNLEEQWLAFVLSLLFELSGMGGPLPA